MLSRGHLLSLLPQQPGFCCRTQDLAQGGSTADGLENALGQLLGPLLPEAFIQGFIQGKPSTNLASFDTDSEHYDSHIQ